jgi:hypothetical protein
LVARARNGRQPSIFAAGSPDPPRLVATAMLLARPHNGTRGCCPSPQCPLPQRPLPQCPLPQCPLPQCPLPQCPLRRQPDAEHAPGPRVFRRSPAGAGPRSATATTLQASSKVISRWPVWQTSTPADMAAPWQDGEEVRPARLHLATPEKRSAACSINQAFACQIDAGTSLCRSDSERRRDARRHRRTRIFRRPASRRRGTSP